MSWGGWFVDAIFISIADAARTLSVGRTKLYQLVDEGRVETVRLGRRRLVKVASLRKLADALANEAR
jgi:excisionase family DNA binding protein